ncbi:MULTISPECIES: spore protease YyaC [Pontibacillus]|uniref:Spore protease YyaC n=1 Tax=Pontibacillus chungwhensis TaxID=265426 RepID=A0ABY8UY45_9BACI|nr:MULTISPECIES: spore protease YyaC [Pontibacillus]MCD5325624.1 spore protease YyaC [Pontibacillus sp. HN14]WIF98128.1 spore protease YyaC [Pontibacillus chungwhensis]
MNLKQRLFSQKTEHRYHYEDEQLMIGLTQTLKEWVPANRDIVVVCIGTDRSTGDSLGPLIGTLLEEGKLQHIHVYGTLDEPVHAVNLNEKLELIQKRYHHPYIIGIDACLGKLSSVGNVILGQGPVKPGAAVKKQLPDVGEIHLTGVVNVSGFMEYFVLQNTRLNIVMQMAKRMAKAIQSFDQQIERTQVTKHLQSDALTPKRKRWLPIKE